MGSRRGLESGPHCREGAGIPRPAATSLRWAAGGDGRGRALPGPGPDRLPRPPHRGSSRPTGRPARGGSGRGQHGLGQHGGARPRHDGDARLTNDTTHSLDGTWEGAGHPRKGSAGPGSAGKGLKQESPSAPASPLTGPDIASILGGECRPGVQ